jgi:hypothetical protein
MADVIQFDRASGARIVKTVHRVERAYYNRPAPRARWPVGGGIGSFILAKCGSGGIAAGSASSPSSATVTRYLPSGTGAGLTTTGGTTLTAYNEYTSAIPANSLVWLANFNEHWYVVTGNCGPS